VDLFSVSLGTASLSRYSGEFDYESPSQNQVSQSLQPDFLG
jgi:hypothetical protein